MQFSSGYLDLKAIIANRLASCGWSLVDDTGMKHTAAVATKMVDTIVGSKVMFAYLTPVTAYRDPSPDLVAVLSGDYTSEGRNALNTCLFSILTGMTIEDIEQGVSLFCIEVDEKVDTTYARNLFILKTSK